MKCELVKLVSDRRKSFVSYNNTAANAQINSILSKVCVFAERNSIIWAATRKKYMNNLTI